MVHLDYISCLLTILATVLIGRKSWTGLLLSIVNSIIVCVIGFRTSQFGFIPANLFCICVYLFSIRSWVNKTHTQRIRNYLAVRVGTTAATMVNASCTPIVHDTDSMRIQSDGDVAA
jgi:nicotinamide riboside transporter PnuC